MKYIIFSDIHLHNYSGGIDQDTRLSKKLLIQKDILQQVIDLAIEQDAIILFGGDLVHAVGNVPVEVINIIHWFFEEIKRCGIKFYAVEGNHDQVIRNNCPTTHSILSPFQNREQRNRELSLLKPTIRLVDYDQIDEVEKINGFDIVVIHAQPDLTNKHNFHMEGVNWKKITKNNKFVFFGHDHTRRELSKFCYVVGSPMQLTMNDFGEDRGCYLVDSETWNVEFKKLNYPELKKLEKIEAKEETKFEERIKSTSFQDILVEWLDREQKPQTYLDLIQKDITDKAQIAKTFFNGKITNIYLKDFLSIDEIRVELKNGFWLVMGKNGTGKTSITGEGIYWILFDETTKDLSKSEIVRDRPTKQKEAIGELTLRDNTQFYTIRRSSKNGLEILSNNKNLVDGMTKIQSQEFLEKHILGFDKNTYLASCYFSQEQLLTLAQLGDADTTNLVTNLLGFETYDSLYVQMDLKKKEATLQLEQLEKDILTLDNNIWKNQEQQKNLNEQIVEANKTISSLNSEHSTVSEQLKELNTSLNSIVIPTVTTEEIDDSLLNLNDQKSKLSIKQKTLRDEGLLRTQDLRQKITVLQNDLSTIIQEQNKIDKEKSKIETVKNLALSEITKHKMVLDSLKESKCSYCGTILNKEELEKHVIEEQAIITSLESSVKDNTSELDTQLNTLYDKEAQSQELLENINKQILVSDAEIKTLLDANYAEITKIEEDIKRVQKDRDNSFKALTEANSRKDSLTSQIKQLESRKLSLNDRIKQINVDEKSRQIDALVVAFNNYNSDKLAIAFNKNKLTEQVEIYTFWQNSFSNKGIRTLLLDKFVNSFNEIVKHFCYEVSGGDFIVQFTPTSKIKSGLERNKLGLEVIYKDKIINYSSLSGGEKTRASVPLCFGLNKFISKMYNVPNGLLGIMVLDEMFCYTDENFRESVADMLNEEGKNKSIFVIDHADTLSSYTDKIWNVSKINDITQLQII